MPQVAADEAIEVFDLVMGDVIRSSATKMTKKRLRSLRDLDAAALLLRKAWLAVCESAADPDGGDIMKAVTFVKSLKGRRKLIEGWETPVKFLSAAWLRRAFPPEPAPVGIADKRAYVVATEALRVGLHRHEIYVPGLRKWGDPNARLLSDNAWKAARPRVCEELDLDLDPTTALAGWVERLDRSHRELVNGLTANPAARIEQHDGRDRIILTGLDRLEVPDSLDELDRQIDARLPPVDLPEMVLEVNSWVPYLTDFTHVSEAESRMDSLELSMAAVLTAEATNVGMEPNVHDGVEALSRDRLFWVEQNYLRSQTLSRANARLVAFHTLLPLVQAWGGGELASADGLRFITPIRTLNSGPNPKY